MSETPFPHSQNCVAFYTIQSKSEKKYSCYDKAYYNIFDMGYRQQAGRQSEGLFQGSVLPQNNKSVYSVVLIIYMQ